MDTTSLSSATNVVAASATVLVAVGNDCIKNNDDRRK